MARRGPVSRALDYVLQEREKFIARVSVWLNKFLLYEHTVSGPQEKK